MVCPIAAVEFCLEMIAVELSTYCLLQRKINELYMIFYIPDCIISETELWAHKKRIV